MTRAEEAALKAYSKGPTVNMGYEDYDQYSKERRGFIQGYKQAEKDLGWISVKERLPGPSEWVVACVEVDGICTCLTLAIYNEYANEWYTDNWEDGEPEVYNPDYWMPIPSKIKEYKK